MAITPGLILNTQFTSQDAGQAPAQTPSYSVNTTVSAMQSGSAVFSDFAKRLQNVEWQQSANNVGGDNILSKIALSQEAILIQSSKIGIAGQVTFADWYRDVNGKSTGVLDPSITQIRGGVIQTEKIVSADGLSWLNLDATGATPFLECGSTVAIHANGDFTFGSGTNTLAWSGGKLSMNGVQATGIAIDSTSTLNGLSLPNYLNSNITLGTLGAGSFATLNSLTAANIGSYIAAGAIGSNYIGSVSATSILAGTLAAGVLYSGTISANNITAGTIGSNVVYAGTVNASNINAGTLASNVTYSGTINATQINAGTITGFTIDSSVLNGATGTFSGNITSGGNVDVTGYVHASGSYSVSGYSSAIAGTSANSNAVLGVGTSTFSTGVIGVGQAPGSSGVVGQGSSSGAVGVSALNNSGGTALMVTGPMTVSTTGLVTNLNAQMWNSLTWTGTGTGTGGVSFISNRPGTAGNNNPTVWWTLNFNGTNYYIPLWT